MSKKKILDIIKKNSVRIVKGGMLQLQDIMFEKTSEEISNLNKWISVEERLPEKEGHYLVVINNTVVCGYYLDKESGAYPKGFYDFMFDNGQAYCRPTHWMPIPNPPNK